MRVLVTGGAGFIGSHLCDRLLADGHHVTCMDNLSTGRQHNIEHNRLNVNFKFVHEDIVECGFSDIDVVYHLATCKKRVADGDPELGVRTDVLGTIRLLKIAKQTGVKRFVYISTGSVYGEVNGRINEITPTNPVSVYGVNKLAAEYYVKMLGNNTTIFRLFHVYGDRQDDSEWGGVIARWLKLAKNGEALPIYGDGKQTRDFIYVDDVVEANLLAAAKDKSGVFNVGTGRNTSLNEVVRLLNQKLGTNIEPIYKPNRIKNYVLHTLADTSKAEKELDFKAKVSLEEGIVRLLEYY